MIKELRDIPEDVPNFGARWYKPKETFRPLPCVRDEHGEIKGQTVKQIFQKINEELDELKNSMRFFDYAETAEHCVPQLESYADADDVDRILHEISEEAADVITAVTTLEEALGIDATMRDEAQRKVNEKNRRRNRL